MGFCHLHGIPFWDVGQLEYCWQDIYEQLDNVDCSGLKVAMFGLGDQYSYQDTYQDAMGLLYKSSSNGKRKATSVSCRLKAIPTHLPKLGWVTTSWIGDRRRKSRRTDRRPN